MSQVFVSPVAHYDKTLLNEAIKQQFANMGLCAKDFEDKRIALKPNLLLKRSPEGATTTHPLVVQAVIETLFSYGVKPQQITLAESPGGLYNPLRLNGIYKESGMEAVANETGIGLNQDVSFQEVKTRDARLVQSFSLIRPIVEADLVISICKLKTHCMTGLSGGVKNLFGCVPGLQKPQLHSRFTREEDFCAMLVDLCETVRPFLTVVDAVVSMEGDGPSAGVPRETGMVLSSRDVYAQDVVLAQIIGMDPLQIGTIRTSVERGLCRIEEIELVGEAQFFSDFALPKTKQLDFSSNVPRLLTRPVSFIIRHLLSAAPQVNEKVCIGCGRCAESCPEQTISLENHKANIHRKACIKCYCCHEMCPVKAISVKRRRWLERM